MQLDKGERGFSFSKEGPLEMQMGPDSELSARDVVNRWPEKELGELIREYGEEPRWRRAAKAIVESRKRAPIETTKQLADILVSTFGFGKRGKMHPATLVFQALRICVNRELEALSEALPKAIKMLSTGGRIGVISFQSLEDKIVKNVFKEASSPPVKRRHSGMEMPLPLLRLLTKKPLIPSDKEVRGNPRSRSAKMRFAEKL